MVGEGGGSGPPVARRARCGGETCVACGARAHGAARCVVDEGDGALLEEAEREGGQRGSFF